MAGKWQGSRRGVPALVAALMVLVVPRGGGQAVLSVRSGVGTRVVLSRAAGEQQLMALSRTAASEDAWLFTEDSWTDVGYDEGKTEVLLDLDQVTAAARGRDPADPLALYHLHPLHEDARLIDPPSLQDVLSLELLKEQCDTGITGVIFDGRGKWTFDIGARLQAIIRQRRPLAADYSAVHGYGLPTNPEFFFERSFSLIAWEENSSPDGRDERIRRFIESAGKLDVIVTYTPIEP